MQACYSVCFAIAYYAYLCTSGMFLICIPVYHCHCNKGNENNIFDTACYWSRFSNELLYSNSSSQITDKA